MHGEDLKTDSGWERRDGAWLKKENGALLAVIPHRGGWAVRVFWDAGNVYGNNKTYSKHYHAMGDALEHHRERMDNLKALMQEFVEANALFEAGEGDDALAMVNRRFLKDVQFMGTRVGMAAWRLDQLDAAAKLMVGALEAMNEHVNLYHERVKGSEKAHDERFSELDRLVREARLGVECHKGSLSTLDRALQNHERLTGEAMGDLTARLDLTDKIANDLARKVRFLSELVDAQHNSTGHDVMALCDRLDRDEEEAVEEVERLDRLDARVEKALETIAERLDLDHRKLEELHADVLKHDERIFTTENRLATQTTRADCTVKEVQALAKALAAAEGERRKDVKAIAGVFDQRRLEDRRALEALVTEVGQLKARLDAPPAFVKMPPPTAEALKEALSSAGRGVVAMGPQVEFIPGVWLDPEGEELMKDIRASFSEKGYIAPELQGRIRAYEAKHAKKPKSVKSTKKHKKASKQ